MVVLGTGTSVGVPVVGCGCDVCTSSDPHNKRLRCSLVLGLPGGTLLVDTTPDLRTQLLREKIGLVHATLYTHDHADHVFGLDDLRLFPYYLGHAMPVYCEEQVEARIRKSFDYAFAHEASNYAGGVPQIAFQRITTEPFEVLGTPVVPIRLTHGRFRVLGFRFGNVAYCTDTNTIPEESWPKLAGLDVLILDALRPKSHPTHFSLDEAVEVAKRVGAKRTYFTHMSHDLEHEATNRALPEGMELAYDGLRIPLT
ncbi:MAG: MBL fold metallo-hydrolase [Planctomycetota bacterium]|nr:MAG: MBL fold metallo-hydrolase [Planctomycetota bacterium]